MSTIKIIKKTSKCSECGLVNGINNLGDTRFYCPLCGKNLGCYQLKDNTKK